MSRIPRPAAARLSRWLLYAAMALLGASAHAVQITISDGTTTYNCTLGNQTITTVGAISTQVTQCEPPLGGSGEGGGPAIPAGPVTVNAQTTTNRTPTITGTVNIGQGETFNVVVNSVTYPVADALSVSGTNWSLAIPAANQLNPGSYLVTARLTNQAGTRTGTANLVIQAESTQPGVDPGIGSGLWSPDPNASPTVYVADQSGGGSGLLTIVPGCLNGGVAGDSCSTRNSFTGTIAGVTHTVQATQGKVISIRYRVDQNPISQNTILGRFDMRTPNGAIFSTSHRMALSPIPGDFTQAVGSFCSSTNGTVFLGGFYCRVDQTKSVYYLNIRVDADCPNCIIYVAEPDKLLY